MACLKTFLSKFNVIISNLAEAGGTTDDNNFLLWQSFSVEFRKIPELKDSIHKIER